MLLAQNFDAIQSAGLGGYSGGNNLGEMITKTLPYIFGAAGIILLIYLVTAGFSMMLSQGDPKAMQGAKAKMTNAVIGFFIVFLAFVIVRLLGQVLGLEGTLFSQIFGGK